MGSRSTVFYYGLHIYLVGVIDMYRAAATKDRVEGQVSRGDGQRDITVAIDIYLAAKKKDSKGKLSRTKLLDYYSRSQRWFFLARPSPVSIFVFAGAANIIVNVLSPLLPNTTSPRLTTSKAEQFYHGPDCLGACGLGPARLSRAWECRGRSWLVRRLGSLKHDTVLQL